METGLRRPGLASPARLKPPPRDSLQKSIYLARRVNYALRVHLHTLAYYLVLYSTYCKNQASFRNQFNSIAPPSFLTTLLTGVPWPTLCYIATVRRQASWLPPLTVEAAIVCPNLTLYFAEEDLMVQIAA